MQSHYEPPVIPPGWYYAEGDPEGTLRRWNGHEWIGFPTRDPSLGVDSTLLQPTRARLTRPTAFLSVACIVALTVLGLAYAALALRIFRDVGELDSWVPPEVEAVDPTAAIEPQGFPLGEIDSYVDNFSGFALAAFGAMAATGLIFLAWIRSAANAVNLVRFRKHQGKRQQGSRAMLIVGVLLFGLFVPLYFVVRGVAGAVLRRFGGGLFDVVNGTAAAASFDPRTQLSTISPIKLVLWWALWWAPLFFTVGAWLWVVALAPVPVTSLQTVLSFTALMTALQVVSIGCILLTVIQITSRLAKG